MAKRKPSITFEKIVSDMVCRDAREWVGRLLDENGIEYAYTEADAAASFHEEEFGFYTYTCTVVVTMARYLPKIYLEVGGTVDGAGILHSVIWRKDEEHKIIWLEVEESRQVLQIEKFRI